MDERPAQPAIIDSPLDLIGTTPLVWLGRLAGGFACQVVGKLPSVSMGSSVRDRL